MRAKYIYEKFREESDPIRDMSIGFKHFLKQQLIIVGSLSPTQTSMKFFGTKQYDKEAYFIFLFLTALFKKSDNSYMNLCLAYDEAREESLNAASLNYRKIDQALKDNYNIVV